MNLEGIARLAGVSRSTVSRVVNNDPRVSPTTRERVQRIIAEQDYAPNAAARSLASQRTRIIGLVLPGALGKVFYDAWFVVMLEGCVDACNRTDQSLMLLSQDTDRPDEAARLINRLIHGRHLDGMIISNSLFHDQLIGPLMREHFPYVVVGRDASRQANFVDIDNHGASVDAVRHLLSHGGRRPLMIAGPASLVAGMDRVRGFRDAAAAAGFEADQAPVIHADGSQRSAFLMTLDLLQRTPPPDAIFAGSDAMAIGVLQAARRLGRRVPDDLAVMGFDDIERERTLQLDLSTVRQPARTLGERAVAILTELIATPPDDTTPPRQEWLPTQLILRHSCGCPPKSGPEPTDGFQPRETLVEHNQIAS